MGLRLIALACLVGAAFAGPFQRQSQQCATRCLTSDHEKFHYEPGKKYVYEYQGVNHLSVAGQKKQQTELSGTAEIHVKTKCEMVLKLKNTRVVQKTTQEEIDELKNKLEIPLPFAYEDGKIDHVCSSPDETAHSLNIKKGILSTLINSMDKLDQSQEVSEDDSLGRCMTKYTVHQLIIEKEKDLKSCTNRHSSMTSLITNPYDSPESAAIHSAPIFPTDKLSCKQTIEDGVIKSCTCKELASFKPLGQKHSLIEFEGHMQLSLSAVQSAENIMLHAMSKQEALVYNLHDEPSIEDLEKEVEDLLRDKCSRTSIIDLSASKDFIFLVSAVKRLSYESLQKLYTSLESGQICSSKRITDMFLDTLPMAGSDGAIRLMVNLLVQQRVTGLKAKLWAASLALVNHPSYEAIKALVNLVKEQKSRPVLLGVSAMVYRHCVYHKCANSEAVKQIITSLNQVLGQGCAYENENEAVAVLKAFGNMGQVQHAEKNILACARDEEKPIRVRLAAIDAFRRVNKKRPDEMLELYAKPQTHYEVRIAALSSVMKRADDRQLATIKTVAESEKHEQVSAYTSSIIASTNRTSCPLKQDVRRRLNEIEIQTPQVGYWDNSKNIELSTFSETLNVGGAVETDIIHSAETKLPRSIHTRFDLDVFDHHLNVFQIGLRAEGLEAAVRKMINFHEPKEEKAPSWGILRSSNDESDEKLEAQFFFRTMDTEIVDISVSDLSSMGEMLQIADILHKISHEKTVDFSHSFMFVNSKLVIPSVTGRSYSFGLTGSATVGLIAKSKVDIVNILSRSKNCDVHGHFQPSVNVELAATVGIHSEKPRPDVKLVTRVHSESHIEALFKIKDNHLGLVKVSVPSENVAYTKISSDIYEVDAYHQERPIYDNMQKKIDYCFDHLEKPLGLSVCGKWEVPRPFMSNTFPFVKGVGNMELAIKKTDPGMKSYELSVEIPKRKSPVMTYKASLDTPGSRINRRFSAELEVREPSREQKQFSFQMKSPFKSASASASGSLTNRQDLIDASFEIQAASFRRYTIKASAPISQSGSEKTYKPSVEISSSPASFRPLKVDGTVTVSNGRKHQIHFDMKANRPVRNPVSVKGTILKDGAITSARNAEWKLSSDVALKSPIINLNVKSSTEKQAKQSHKISSTVTVDYQTESSPRESVKLTTNLQKSSSKISSMAHFETTKYPSANFLLTWNMQGKWRESLKNDVTLKYGRDPEHNYINILHSSRINEQPGECKFAIKAPQFDIDSDVTVTHDIDMDSKLHADVDLRYTEDKHVKAKLHVDKLSQRPLKLKMKAEIQLPERRMFYQDELEEISPNTYKGNAVCEWSPNKRMELQYKYQKRSDRSKFHHEIETSLRLPSSRSPIKHKASIEVSPEKVGIEGRVSMERRSEYTLKAELNKKGASYVNVKVPKLEGNLKVVNDDDKKAADIDVKSTLFRRPRHVTASATLGLGNEKKFETEICLDADRNPEDKFLLSSSYEPQSRNKFECKAKVQISDKANWEGSISGDKSLYGRHETSVEARLLKFESMGFTLRKELSPTKANLMLRLSRSSRPKAEITLEAERSMSINNKEVSASASVKSLDNSFHTKKWSYKGSYSRPSESSMSLKSSGKFEWSPSKIYESEVNFDLQPNVLLSKAYLHTPLLHFERQSVGFTYRKSDSIIASSASIEFSSGKSISVSSETHLIHDDGLKSSLAIRTPFDIVKDAKITVVFDNKPSKKSVKSNMDINGSRKADFELSLDTDRETVINGHLKTTFTPELSANIKCENNKDSFKYAVQVMRDSMPYMSASISKAVPASNQISYSLHSSSKERTLMNLKMVKEVSATSTKHSFEAQGAFPEISFNIESSKKDKNSFTASIQACQKKSVKSCYSLKGYHKALINEENYRFYRKFTLDVEKSDENASPKSLANVNIISSITGNDFREKFTVEMKGEKVGYEVRLHRRENEDDHCSLDSHIFTPSSTIRVRGSILHNSKAIISDFEIVPDASVPSRKLGYEMKKERKGDETTCYLTLHHPERRQPIQVTGSIRQEGIVPVAGKLRINYSSKPKDLILEIVPEQSGRGQLERQAVTYKIYREDKSFEAQAKLMRISSRLVSEYSYDWVYQNQHKQKQGKLSLKLSDKVHGIPRAIDAEIVTPSTSTKMSSHVSWESTIPTAFSWSLMSNNENIYDMELKAEDDCLNAVHRLKSRDFVKHSVCVFKKEDDNTKLLSISSYYHRRKSLSLAVAVDDDSLASIDATWDVKSVHQGLRDIVRVWDEMVPRYLSEEDIHDIQSKIWYWSKVCQDVAGDVVRKMKEFYEEKYHTTKLYLDKTKVSAENTWNYVVELFPVGYIMEHFIRPAIESIRCMYHEYLEIVETYIDENIRAFWVKCIKKLLGSIKAACPPDSFCYEFSEAMENMEVKKMKMLMSRKATHMKKSLSECLEKVKFPNIRELIQEIADRLKQEMHAIMTAISEGSLPQLFNQYARRLENYISEKVKEKYDELADWIRRMLAYLEKDEDFRVLKATVVEYKDWACELMIKGEKWFISEWEPMWRSLKSYSKSWMDEVVTVHKFSPEEGNIKIQIRRPLDSKHVQVLKNMYMSVKKTIVSAQ